MARRHVVALTSNERERLEALAKKGKHDGRSVLLARALLLVDSPPEGPGWQTNSVTKALGLSPRTIERMKKRFVEEGLDQALEHKPLDSSLRDIKFDGAFEAKLIALACSEAPEGKRRWTIRLLADKAVELGIADSVSPMTVQRTLKKMKLNLTGKNTGKSPRR